LSDREATILDFMLSPDDARLEPLREQASRATVTGRWDCCATIELSVEPAIPDAPEAPAHLVVEATTHSRGDADTSFELLLFEKGGWLHTLELVHYGERPPKEFPPVERFESPIVR
jgi:hypothetical protein